MNSLKIVAKFAGPSTFDQPISFRIGNIANTDIRLSCSQIVDCRMVSTVPFVSQSEYEHIVAREIAYEIKQAHQAAREEDFLCLYGNFYGFSAVHQIRSFLARHGVSYYFPGPATVYIDTSYFKSFVGYNVIDDLFKSCDFLDSNKIFLRDRAIEGKLFVAYVSALPPVYEKTFFDYYPIASLHRSVFRAVASTNSGALLLDYPSLYAHESEHGAITKLSQMMKYLVWLNYRTSYLFVPSDEEVVDSFNVVDVPGLKNIGKNRSLLSAALIEKIKLDDYFKLLREKNSCLDIEMDFYRLPPEELYRLNNAIYKNNFSSLVTAPKYCREDLSVLYNRHLMRVHEDTPFSSLRKPLTAEDFEAVKVLTDYVRKKHGPDIESIDYHPMRPASMKEIGKMAMSLDKAGKSWYKTYVKGTPAFRVYYNKL